MTIELKDLIEDIRLARLFAMPGRACALQIWILQVQGYDYLENRFVYARLLPYGKKGGKKGTGKKGTDLFSAKRGQIYFQAVVKPRKEGNISSVDEKMLVRHKRFPSEVSSARFEVFHKP